MSFWRTCRTLLAATLLAAVMHGSAVAQGVAYLQNHNPWYNTANQSELDTVFGAGNWNQFTYAVDPSDLFSNHCFVMMEGGENNDGYLAQFLAANQAAITSWIMGGGSLYVHVAGWYVSPDFTFLGATYVHNSYDGAGYSGSTANPLHPVVNGPYTPTGAAWTGNLFAHAYFSNLSGYSTIIVDGASRPVVIEKSLGAGYVILSGTTTSYWHSPNAQASNLAKNILAYGASKANCVPEPGPIALLIGGALTATACLRRRRAR